MQNNQTLEILRQAKLLITQNQYQNVIDILSPIKSNPTAKEWLDKAYKLQLKKAQDHLKNAEHDKARQLLEPLNHPQAKKWLAKLDTLQEQKSSPIKVNSKHYIGATERISAYSPEGTTHPIETIKKTSTPDTDESTSSDDSLGQVSVNEIETYDSELSQEQAASYTGDDAQKQIFLRKLQHINSNDSRYYVAKYMLIECLMSDSKYAEAIPVCNELLKRVTDWASVYGKRASCHIEVGKLTEADSDYTMQINLPKKDNRYIWMLYMRRGQLRIKNTDYAGALKDANTMQDIANNLNESHFNNYEQARDSILEEVRNIKFDVAIGQSDAQMVNKLFSEYGHTHELIYKANDLGCVLLDAQQFQNAILIFSRAIDANHNPTAPFFNRALCYINLDQYESAIFDLTQYIEINKNNDPELFLYRDESLAKGYSKRAECYQILGNIDAMKQDIQLAKQYGNTTIADPMSLSVFAQQYWLAFVWLGLAGITTLVLALGSTSRGTPGPLLIGYVVIAIFRAYMLGFSPLNINTDDNAGFIGGFIKLVITILAYPLMELFFQGKFLIQVYGMWKDGDVAINEESGKTIRSA